MDIVGLILEVAIAGTTKAKIMNRAYLSIPQMKDYLFDLLENGLLCYGKGIGIYKTTEKGLRLLNLYNHINEQIGQVERTSYYEKI